MTYKAVHIGQPNYLNELIQPYQPVRTLRSSTSALLVIPFVRSDFVSDAFSVSSPIWNNLPQDVRSCTNQVTFKSRLKSGALKMQDQKMQDLKMEDQVAGVENAGPENAGPPVNTANR